jgi:hypothetical protein
MKGIIFWDMTPCSLLSCNRRFGWTYCLYLSAYRLVLAELFLRPWRWRWYVPPKRRLQLNRPHGVISQKMMLFIYSLFNDAVNNSGFIASNDEMTDERVKKKRSWLNLRYYSDICLEGLKATNEKLSQDICCPTKYTELVRNNQIK